MTILWLQPRLSLTIGVMVVTGEVLILLLSDRLVSVPLTLISQEPSAPTFRKLIQQQLENLLKALQIKTNLQLSFTNLLPNFSTSSQQLS